MNPNPLAKPPSRKAFWIIILIAFGLRLAALMVTTHIEPLLDERLYLQRAEALLNGEGFIGSYQSWVRHEGSPLMSDLPQYTGSYQPPFYTMFIAGIYAITGHSVVAVKFAQVILSTVTVGLVYWIACAWFDRKSALIAAAFCAIYPNLIAFSHLLWTETVFTFLVMLAFGLLTTTSSVPSKKSCVIAGVLLAFAAMTRAAILYFIPFLLIWFVLIHWTNRSRAVGRSVLTVMALVVALSPWTIRNYRVHDALVLVDTNGPFNVWRGNAGKHTFLDRPHPPQFSYAPPFQSIPVMPVRANWAPELIEIARKRYNTDQPTDIQIVETAKYESIKNIKDDPGYFIQAAMYKLIDMWNPTSFMIRHFQLGQYGPVNPAIQHTIEWSAILTYVAAMLLAFPGLLLTLRNRHTWLIVLMVGYFCGIHAIAFGLTRFRLPLMPFIIMLAAVGVTKMFAATESDEPGEDEIVSGETGDGA
ncbi:MAG TPA: glycosyltransferase family 39 protein [Phycisphaerae bacterium]|nr:glycosyltransferase family 39 protein [Phycisphaerae bacterium]